MTPLPGGLGQGFLDSLREMEGEQSKTVEQFQKALNQSISESKQDAHSLNRVLTLVRRLEKVEADSGTDKWFNPTGLYPITMFPKHKAFFDAGKIYPERLLMAANRAGKSVCGALETTFHATGNYPPWWEGRRFSEPTNIWVVGKDAKAVRDTSQELLLGPTGEWGTGMLPAHALGKMSAMQGTAQAIDTLLIKHVSGGWSRIGFKNCAQDIGSFMGTSRHVVWADEEVPLDIYNECNIRTATVDGIMMLTFTPLLGMTPLVINFCRHADFLVGAKPLVTADPNEEESEEDFVVGASTAKAVIQLSWKDAPWVDDATKARLLADTPAHLRKTRSEGTPQMGLGSVYITPLEDFVIDPINIPDSWPRMYGLDVGWNRTAAVWCALDIATDTVYVYSEHYQGKKEPSEHAYAIQSRGDWIPGVIDPAAAGRSQADGKQLIQTYKSLGLDLRPAKNAIEAGIMLISQRLEAGKLKVFKTLPNFQKEYFVYSRDKHGNPVARDNHALDALKYVILNLKYAKSKSEIKGLGMRYVAKKYNV